MTLSQNITLSRRYDVDAVRILAFGLLIFYHIGMFYVADWGWHVKSAYQSETLQYFMLFSNQWRMALIFVVSGMATYFLFAKLNVGAFMRKRSFQLLVPLVFGMLFIVPPQPYLEMASQSLFAGSYGEFLSAYFGLSDWPQVNGEEHSMGLTWNHLWYLPYLLFYTLILTPVFLLLKKTEGRVRKTLDSLPMWGWLAINITWLTAMGLVVFPLFPEMTHALVDDWYSHAMYGTFFLLGYLMMCSDRLWSELVTYRKWLLLGGVFSFATYIVITRILPDDSPYVPDWFLFGTVYANRTLWIFTIMAFAHKYLNRPMVWVDAARPAVYPCYILHQSITVVAGYWLATLSLGPVIEPFLVIVATIGGCVLLYVYLIRPSRWLHPLMGVYSRDIKRNAILPTSRHSSELDAPYGKASD